MNASWQLWNIIKPRQLILAGPVINTQPKRGLIMISNSHLLYKLWEIIHDLESSFWDAFEDVLMDELNQEELAREHDLGISAESHEGADDIPY